MTTTPGVTTTFVPDFFAVLTSVLASGPSTHEFTESAIAALKRTAGELRSAKDSLYSAQEVRSRDGNQITQLMQLVGDTLGAVTTGLVRIGIPRNQIPTELYGAATMLRDNLPVRQPQAAPVELRKDLPGQPNKPRGGA